jgi:hypothetical protein
LNAIIINFCFFLICMCDQGSIRIIRVMKSKTPQEKYSQFFGPPMLPHECNRANAMYNPNASLCAPSNQFTMPQQRTSMHR